MKRMMAKRLLPHALWVLCLMMAQLLTAQDAIQTMSENIRIGLLIEDEGYAEAREGAELAVRQINEEGGLSGRKLELLVRSMEGPWGKGSKQAVELIFDQEVWALIGSSQGRNAHLVEQVIAKTNVVFVSAWASDPTLAKAYVPHFFNCVPNSDQRAETIARQMEERGSLDNWLLVHDGSYDSSQSVNSLLNQEKVKRNLPVAQILCESPRDLDKVTARIADQNADAIVLFCNKEMAIGLSDRLRSRGIQVPIYLDAEAAGETSDLISSYAYDAVMVLAEAIRRSANDPARLREAMTLTDYQGRTGNIQFDERGNRIGLPSMVETGEQIFSFRMH